MRNFRTAGRSATSINSGEKIAGAYTNEYGKADVADRAIKDGNISFKVKREMNGKPFIIRYSGKVSGGWKRRGRGR
jgi:hypothetical protein